MLRLAFSSPHLCAEVQPHRAANMSVCCFKQQTINQLIGQVFDRLIDNGNNDDNLETHIQWNYFLPPKLEYRRLLPKKINQRTKRFSTQQFHFKQDFLLFLFRICLQSWTPSATSWPVRGQRSAVSWGQSLLSSV